MSGQLMMPESKKHITAGACTNAGRRSLFGAQSPCSRKSFFRCMPGHVEVIAVLKALLVSPLG